MTPDVSRTCPFCAETIHAAAKVCPRCRQWLSLRSIRHPIVGFLAVSLPVLLGLGVLRYGVILRFERMFNPPPFYSEMPNALVILESRMNWVQTTNGPRIYVTGILTNRSAVAWKDIEFECRFFGTNGVMLDAANTQSRFTILAEDDLAFRVVVVPARSAGDYHALKVLISNARNDRALF